MALVDKVIHNNAHGWRYNVTDDDDDDSPLFEIQLEGVTKFRVEKGGKLTTAEVFDAVTATATGLTTGLIPASANYIVVASSDANFIATLPVPVVGKVIQGWVGAIGFELRTVDASGITINGLDSDGTKEAAIPATTLFEVTCVAATGWILRAWDELGAAITAIVPD